MKQRHGGMVFDWKPTVRCRDKEAAADAGNLVQKRCLGGPAPHVLDHGIAEHDIEVPIREG
jgi:hypothetical protein